MGKHRSERFKKKVVKEILAGTSIPEIIERYSIPESTIYKWLSEYRERKFESGHFTLRQYLDVRRRMENAERELKIVVNSPFIQSIPLPIRQEYMERLEKEKEIPSHILCEAFDVNHATYHHFKYDNARDKAWFVIRQHELERLITKIYAESGGIYGAKKIKHILQRDYHKRASESFIRNIMRQNGFSGATPKQIKRGANVEYKEAVLKRNLLRQNFHADAPNEKWVLDSKQFYAKRKCFHICIVEDLYSRRVISYGIGVRESGRLVCTTLREAFKKRKPKDGLIVHTDGSLANKSMRVNRLIRSYGAIHSYSEVSNPYDNSPVESFFSHFSAEFLVDTYKNHPFHSVKEMRSRIDSYIEEYNMKRPHEYNNGLTPSEKEQAFRRAPKKETTKAHFPDKTEN